MRTRAFGSTGWQVGEVGLGCWQIGGADWGDISDATAFEILDAAAGCGVDFLDTADVYGSGRSETLIGTFLRQRKLAVRVATKLGRLTMYPDGYTEAAMREATEASLRRLGVEALSLTQLHCVPTAVMRRGDVFEWLRRQQAQGLIEHFGASVESMEEALLCVEQPGLVSLQIIFNVFRQRPARVLFERAKARGVAIIVRLPLASGLLSGEMTRRRAFADNDHRRYNRDGQAFNVGETFAGLPFEKGVVLADALRAHVPPGLTLAQLAMRWILDHDAVSAVIPGASRASQVIANVEAAALPPLGASLHEQLAAFYDREVARHVRGPD
jgi:aryl-alcohol dehydrogenase-like predicted oxidoreductase